jgi:hypothetical protein
MTNIQDSFLCQVCSEKLKEPRRLPCNHSFCSDCCSKLISDRIFICPFCSDSFPQETKFGDLKEDITMQKRMQIKELLKSGQKFCYECQEVEPAQTFCSNCQTFLCEDHSKLHKKVRKPLIIH